MGKTRSRWGLLAATVMLGLCASLALAWGLGTLSPPPAKAADAPAGAGGLVLLAWNDLGMHCYNYDFQDIAVLPPYNTLWAQVVRPGDPPQIVTTGITVTYVFSGNTYSVGKTNFWTYAQAIFGLPAPLPDNIGLKGKGLTGTLDLAKDHFIAEGIPLTEFLNNDHLTLRPYQLAIIRVLDSSTQAVLAEQQVVTPVSSEMHCDTCHSDTGDATVGGGITPTGRVGSNILALHDKLSQSEYPAGHTGPLMSRRPVLCAECHSSNALGAPGVAGLPSLSNAMHDKHAEVPAITPDTAGCYNCHPGTNTRCLRDVMSQKFNFTCLKCHGDMTKVSQNPNPWLNEPRCDGCHGVNARQDSALYRFSKGHSGLYCEGCHDSTHAIAESREPKDALKFVALQGRPGTLNECTVCHTVKPGNVFSHAFLQANFRVFLPQLKKTY